MQPAHRQPGILGTFTRNSLRRSPVPTVVLTAFVALAAMLASSAAVLLVTVGNATADLMDKSRTAHFVQMHAGEVDEQRLAAFVAGNELVDDHAVHRLLNVDGAAIRVIGADTDSSLAAAMQDNAFVTANQRFDLLLDLDDQVIDPQRGSVWLPVFYQDTLNLSAGNTLLVTGGGYSQEFTVAGFLRDSQMNPSYAGSKRLLVAEPDLAALTAGLGVLAGVEHVIEFRLSDADAVAQFETQYREAGLEANGPSVTWSLFALLNSMSTGMTAALVALATVLLLAIALLCVRFTLLTAIEQDYREIGVLKALGMRDAQLLQLYSRRYLLLAGAGAAVGMLASVGLSHLLLREVRWYLGAGGQTPLSVLAGFTASAAIVAIVAVAIRRTLRRLQQVPAGQAIRADAATNQSRRRVPNWPTVAASRLATPIVLGVRDLVRRPGLYLVPAVIFTLAAVLLVLPQNLHNTITSPRFVTYMGVGVSDIRIDVRQPADPARVAEVSAELAGDPRIADQVLLETAAYTVLDASGKRAIVKVESGDLTAFPVTYLTGRIPASDTEIALSALQADVLGTAVGDSVTIVPAGSAAAPDGSRTLTITGVYQDITNGGRTAKMLAPHTSGELMWSVLYADVTPGTAVQEVIADYAAENPNLKVGSVAGYVEGIVGGSIDAVADASRVATAVGLLVSALIAALFLRLLLARDARSVGIMRAIGLRSRHIGAQYLVRMVVLLVAGTALGTVLAGALGRALAGLLLSPIGISRIAVVADPLVSYLVSPVALLLTVTATTLAATRSIGRATIANIGNE